MFTQLHKEQLDILDADVVYFQNTYGAINPRDWIDGSTIDQDFFSHLGLVIKNVSSTIVFKQSLKKYTTFCFTINGDEAYFHVSQPHEYEAFNGLMASQESRKHAVSEIIVEYAVRKFLAHVHKHLKLEPLPQMQFIGVDSTQKETVCDQAIEIRVLGENFEIRSLLSLPQSFLARVIKDEKFGSSTIQEISSNSEEEDVQFRFDISSFYVSTNSLIDIIKGEELIMLPSSAKFDLVHMHHENGDLGVGKLRRVHDQVMCVLDQDNVPSLQNQKSGTSPQSLLTCSLGYYSYSVEQLKQMPLAFPLDGCTYPEVLLIVGNEVIAHGKLGLFESSTLCVKVSA